MKYQNLKSDFLTPKQKNNIMHRKIILLVILSLLIGVSACSIFAKANETEVTVILDAFKDTIQSTGDECWKHPAQNRKDTMCNKLTELQQLLADNNFEEAYDKFLHDIKPKLTGLKTDEQEQPWGNGVYKQAWVTCENLRETFRLECNSILKDLNPQSDSTPPIVNQPEDIEYLIGTLGHSITWIATDENPDYYTVFLDNILYVSGEWESGISIIVNIDGLLIGVHEFMITIFDDYGNFADDVVFVTVHEDNSAPNITIDYDGESNMDDPGFWSVYIEDLESGVDTVTIRVDGSVVVFEEQLGGVPTKSYDNIAVPAVEKIHKIIVIAKDLNQNEAQVIQEKRIFPGSSPPPPPIIVG